MEIIVQGVGETLVSPNQIQLELHFYYKADTYETALENGSVVVENFVTEVLEKFHFSKDEMKTRSFVIREERRYDSNQSKYFFDGFSFNQNATLKFDYNRTKMSEMMEAISKLENAPKYEIHFGIKDEKTCKRDLLKIAYEDALEQAQAIALAAGKKLSNCVKVDFKPFTIDYVSATQLNEPVLARNFEMADRSAASRIESVFTPEDIMLKETLYCLWVTE